MPQTSDSSTPTTDSALPADFSATNPRQYSRAGGALRRLCSRRVQAAVLSVAVCAGAAWFVDMVSAARAEAQMSDEILDVEHNHGIDTLPRVSIAGFPFLTSVAQDGVSHIEVSLVDVPTDEFGAVTVTTTAHDVQGPARSLLSGSFDDLTGFTISRSVRVDAAALGRVLGMVDVDISNPKDVSPSAAPLSRVQLSGTPQGCDSPAVVLADLRVREQVASIEPVELLTAPEECSSLDVSNDAQVMSHFEWSAPASTLPTVGMMDSWWVRGGSLVLTSGLNKPTPLSAELFTTVNP